MWRKLLDFLYDASICAFSIIDIFCDVFVTIQFYRNGHIIFFWISIFILLLAQISYTVLVCFSLEPILPNQTMTWRKRQQATQKKYIKLFVMVLPFGQLVPLYLMIANSFPETFESFYDYIGFRNLLNDMKKDLFFVTDNTTTQKTHSDPLSLYIRHKLMSHLGFCIESLIEAVPQSILQMVFLIMYSSNSQSVSLINFISIIMSMIVVTSKGTILSYSIYRSAAVFNFLCFAIDIFGIFCVVSWLFCANPDMDDNDDDVFEYTLFGYKMWSASYYYFKILQTIFKCIAIAALCAICMAINNSYRQSGNQPWRRLIEIPIAGCIATLIFFPVALICLMVRFTLLPLLVLRAFDHSQNTSFQYYNSIFSFLTDSSSISEMHEKLLLSHWLFADSICKNSLSRCGTMCYDIQQRYIKKQSISLSFLYSKLRCPMLAKYHQILEVVSLLCSRKGLWAFLFAKIIFMVRLNSQNNRYLKYIVQCLYYILRAMYLPLEMEDISFLWNNNGILNETQQTKFDALETIFHDTVTDIQNIIDWEHFARRIQHIVDKVLSIDVKQHWVQFKAEVAWKWDRFRRKYTMHYIQSQVISGVRWFFVDGLCPSVKQDVVNIYNTLCGNENRQLSKWNIPRCWSSFSIMFGSKGYDQGAQYWSVQWSAYQYTDLVASPPWIGRGLYVFIVVICYKCIHDPIRWCVSRECIEAIAVYIGAACGVCIVILVLLLALYSVFLPIIFLIQHVWHFGISLEHNPLQIVLTLFYFVILSAMIGLFSRVWKFVYCDIHLFRFFCNDERIPQKYAQLAIEAYHAAPIRDQIVMERFGSDLGGLLLVFLPKWHILNDRDDIEEDVKLNNKREITLTKRKRPRKPKRKFTKYNIT